MMITQEKMPWVGHESQEKHTQLPSKKGSAGDTLQYDSTQYKAMFRFTNASTFASGSGGGTVTIIPSECSLSRRYA